MEQNVEQNICRVTMWGRNKFAAAKGYPHVSVGSLSMSSCIPGPIFRSVVYFHTRNNSEGYSTENTTANFVLPASITYMLCSLQCNFRLCVYFYVKSFDFLFIYNFRLIKYIAVTYSLDFCI